MPFFHTTPLDFHEGERKVQSLLHAPDQDNPTSIGLSPHATRLLHVSSLLAVGTLDKEGQPWTTLLGGEPGFARSLGQSIISVKSKVARQHDPVVNLLVDSEQDGEVHGGGKDGRVISALGIHLATRDRIKLSGRLVAGALGRSGSGAEEDYGAAEIQLILAIHQSLGNCPKYLNRKHIILRAPKPALLSDSLPFSDPALKLLAKADMFFISSSNHETNMGTNHRGGSPGFVRLAQNDEHGTILVYPEFSGNRLYQTLGNLCTTPRAGLIFPDFDTGDALYVTGTTEIRAGKDAATVLPRSNVLVRLNVVAARFVEQGLGFLGQVGELSPYNPPIRFLATEQALPDVQTSNNRTAYAKLLSRELLTPTIARFRFSVSDPETAGRWKPGQYVALAFEDELSLGYSHMRDDDPKSLNDDYVRTFTVSSPSGGNLPEDEFEITIRNVGAVTNFLFRQNIRAGLEVPLKGFGGTFAIEQGHEGVVPIIAGGIGVTPILAQLNSIDLNRIRLFWAVNVQDVGLVLDTLERCPPLASSTRIFVSAGDKPTAANFGTNIKKLEGYGAHVVTRRILASDLEPDQDLSPTWYLCVGKALRKTCLSWLPDKKTVYEDFDY